MTTGYAPINGLKMYYEIHGEGQRPLVLIHGGGSTIESSFARLLPLLAAHTKVIALELQAHGRTSDRNAPESFEQDADDVAALLKHLAIEKADILGFSNGGTTALHLAARYPGLVRRLIVVSANYQREGLIAGFYNGFGEATLEHMPGPLKEAYLKVNFSQEGLQTMFEKDKQRMLGYKDMADEALRSIKVPVLLMVSDRDVITIEHVLKMSRMLPDARLVVLPGVHGTLIGEVCVHSPGSGQPAITASLVHEFLKE